MQPKPRGQMREKSERCEQSDVGFFGPFFFAAFVPVRVLLCQSGRGNLMWRGALRVFDFYIVHKFVGPQPSRPFNSTHGTASERLDVQLFEPSARPRPKLLIHSLTLCSLRSSLADHPAVAGLAIKS